MASRKMRGFCIYKKNNDNISLKSYLGEIYKQLIEFSAAIGKQVECYEILINAN